MHAKQNQNEKWKPLPPLPTLFTSNFSDDSWWLWSVVLKAAFGEGLDSSEQAAFAAVTDRQHSPTSLRELWAIVGRRGGKDAVAAFIALYLACARNWRREFTKGETVVGMIICPDRRQGRVALNYMADYARTIPEFGALVSDVLKESIEFYHGIRIEIHTASFRSVRGYTVPFAILDEIAFFRSDDSANPDSEIIAALKPAMATVPDPLLIGISTPYARRGELWGIYRDHYGQEDDSVLVIQGPTRAFNPLVPQDVIDDAFQADPVVAAAEYGDLEVGLQFRSDVEGYASLESVQACLMPGVRELPWNPMSYYAGFVDPSGGSADSFTAAVAHRERDGQIVLDAVRERRPPFSPEEATKDLAEFLKSYRVHMVSGDYYGGEWPREQFRKHGIEYQISEKNKSEIYGETLPLLNSGRAKLLDDARLINQLTSLERRTSRGGRDSIDHPPGGHDDVVNAALGAVLLAQTAGSVSEVVTGSASSAKNAAEGFAGARFRGGY